MKTDLKLLDVVALLEDIPEEKLFRGEVGTIVEEFENNFVEVEFSDSDGVAYAFADLSKDKLLLLHFNPVVETALAA
jgi:hypothetical protein